MWTIPFSPHEVATIFSLVLLYASLKSYYLVLLILIGHQLPVPILSMPLIPPNIRLSMPLIPPNIRLSMPLIPPIVTLGYIYAIPPIVTLDYLCHTTYSNIRLYLCHWYHLTHIHCNIGYSDQYNCILLCTCQYTHKTAYL